LLVGLIEGAAGSALAACGALLAHVAGWGPSVAVAAARRLIALLPADGVQNSPALLWGDDRAVRPTFIVDLFIALGAIDPGLANAAVDHVLASPTTYDFDTALVPASLALLAMPEAGRGAAVRRLRSWSRRGIGGGTPQSAVIARIVVRWPGFWAMARRRSGSSRRRSTGAAMWRRRSGTGGAMSITLRKSAAVPISWCARRTRPATSADVCSGRRIYRRGRGWGHLVDVATGWGDSRP
jgi:hypothetical protein